MYNYKVIDRHILITGGIIELTQEQARIRLHCLKKTGTKNQYEVTQQFHLKIGEVFSTKLKFASPYVKDLKEEKAAGK